MNTSPTDAVSQCDCECGTGQTQSTIACPVCRKLGATVGIVTPQHTLKKDARNRLNADNEYHFCENPDCDVVYYNGQDTSVFTTSDLVNRVTIKDDSPDTRLCYCFKVLKQQALDEIARTGTTDVFKTIQSKMKPGQSCFCEKSNPRGDTCVKDIRAWLEAQGVTTEQGGQEDTPTKEDTSGGCCSDAAVVGQNTGGCCSSEPTNQKPKGGCC